MKIRILSTEFLFDNNHNWKQQIYIYFYEKIIVHPKLKISLPQAIQDVDQIWRNVALHHFYTYGSSAVNGCRQNESPNITIIHMIYSSSVNVVIMCCEMKGCQFVRKKSIFNRLFNSLTGFNVFFSEKVHPLSCVDYCDVFISWWTLILTAPIHCRGSTVEQVMQCKKSVLMKKQTHLHSEWPERELIFSIIIFEWAVPLKMVTFSHIWYKNALRNVSAASCYLSLYQQNSTRGPERRTMQWREFNYDGQYPRYPHHRHYVWAHAMPQKEDNRRLRDTFMT